MGVFQVFFKLHKWYQIVQRVSFVYLQFSIIVNIVIIYIT